MRGFLGALLAVVTTACHSGSVKRVLYEVDESNFCNPERGFYHYTETRGSKYSPLYKEDLLVFRKEGITQIYRICYLDTFKTAPISDQFLKRLDKDFAVVRLAGIKVILRFAYTLDMKGDDTSIDWVKKHLTQLAPVMAANKDVIEVVQAGFIGAWGEWYYTQNFGHKGVITERDWANRRALVEALLNAVPKRVSIQLRTPNYKRKLIRKKAVTSEEAFTGKDVARVGFHDDAFCADETHMGTFSEPTEELYMAEESKFVPMGGETNQKNPPFSDWPNVEKRLKQFHYSYLNIDYHKDVLKSWGENLETCKRRLGYRFVLKDSELSKSRGGYRLTIGFANAGYAAPFNRRGCDLVLRHVTSGRLTRIAVNADPRRWLPGNHRLAVRIPGEGLASGTYELFLHLPDPAKRLRNRPEYAIRTANRGTWEEKTGFNRLQQTIVVE